MKPDYIQILSATSTIDRMMLKTTATSLFFCSILFLSIHAKAQTTLKRKDGNLFYASQYFPEGQRGEKKFRIVFYNVENFFDIYDDPLTNDGEFTPNGSKRWSQNRFQSKRDKLAKTLIATGGWEPPEFIGLCEVENSFVLQELITFSPLKNYAYEMIHQDSPDRRGIDVAALYRPDKMELVSFQYHSIVFPGDTTYKTRDILEVQGKLLNDDSVYFFINHWPSRRGGQKASEFRRLKASEVLAGRINEIVHERPDAEIVVMGDFNDHPDNESILQLTEDHNPGLALINLMQPMLHKAGTHIYRGKWGLLDQFLISGSLNDNEGLELAEFTPLIFDFEWLFEKSTSGELRLYRTFLGPRYVGGYSDHLPILLDLEIK